MNNTDTKFFGNERSQPHAFTLIEILVATSVLVLILGAMLALTNQTSALWMQSNARVEAFQGARIGFETLTQYLGQATLNTYYDYDDANNPQHYKRQSELHFWVDASGGSGTPGTEGTGQAVFFQAPANKTDSTNSTKYNGMMGLLNAMGFYVEYGSNSSWLPAHVSSTNQQSRFRLLQWIQDTEALEVYQEKNRDWVQPNAAKDVYPLADNVIALVIWPKEEGDTANLLNRYDYDSRSDDRSVAHNQLPPVIQVAMVAMDEASAVRLGTAVESTIQEALNGLFQSNDPEKDFTQDLDELDKRLGKASINHRIFMTSIPMREAKWSPDAL